MTQKNKIELLWSEIATINNIDDRKMAIYVDVQSNLRKYEILAVKDPHRLFKILGGNESEINTQNWAFEYSYDDYVQENELEYDDNEAEAWDLESESIENAHNTGYWYVTGTCLIEGPDNIELEFEFEYCDGYLERIIGTPYNKDEHGNHGFLFI